MRRVISHTEIATVLDCQARWDFRYGGHLTGGDALNSRVDVVRLRAGKAWGRGVAAMHASTSPDPHKRLLAGFQAMWAEFHRVAAHARQEGFYNAEEHADLWVYLTTVLAHYHRTSEPLDVTDEEFALVVPVPSRSGRGHSNRYTFLGYLDALTRIRGRLYIVEYKLRDTLSEFEQVLRDRQCRRYAWAAEQVLEEQVAGVIVDERLNAIPKPARWVWGKPKSRGRVPSHAKDQMTTAELYVEACEEADVAPERDTIDALDARRWQIRHPSVVFTRFELEEAGRELVSAANLIAQLDRGDLYPVRHPTPRLCSSCTFKGVCPRPRDRERVDVEFTRIQPKRLRPPSTEVS